MIHFCYVTGITPFFLDGMCGRIELLDVDGLRGSPCSTLFGYTEDEIEHYFSEHLKELSLKEDLSRDEVIKKLSFLYNGYNWHRDRSDCCRVLNPFSINCCLSRKAFGRYWMRGGVASWLRNLLNKYNYDDLAMECISFTRVWRRTGLASLVEEKPCSSFLCYIFSEFGFLTEKTGDDAYDIWYSFAARETFASIAAQCCKRSEENQHRVAAQSCLEKGEIDGFFKCLERIFNGLRVTRARYRDFTCSL